MGTSTRPFSKTKITVAGCCALLAAVAPAAPASAEAASTASATAIGLVSTGLLPLPPTPTVTATQPPDSGERRQVPVDLRLPPLAVTATTSVVAEASRETRVPTPAFPELMDNALRRHVSEAATNARAFTRTEGLGLVVGAAEDPVQGLLTDTLVAATAVETSAIARCVAGQALFDTDYRVVGLRVVGQNLGLERVLAPILAGLNLPGLVSVRQGEAGPLPDGGVFINGLHIVIPLLNVDLIVGRSEARMPAHALQYGGRLHRGSGRDPQGWDHGHLAATGARSGFLQGGAAAIGGGVALQALSRRWRRAEAPGSGRRAR